MASCQPPFGAWQPAIVGSLMVPPGAPVISPASTRAPIGIAYAPRIFVPTTFGLGEELRTPLAPFAMDLSNVGYPNLGIGTDAVGIGGRGKTNTQLVVGRPIGCARDHPAVGESDAFHGTLIRLANQRGSANVRIELGAAGRSMPALTQPCGR